MSERPSGTHKLGDWLRAKLESTPEPDAVVAARPAIDEVAALAADVARLGWGTVEPAATTHGGTAAAVESSRRLAFIVAYARNPAGHPVFADLPLVFQLVSKEHVYQRARTQRLAKDLAALGDDRESPDFIRINAAHSEANTLQSRLFRLMKKLAGQADTATVLPPPLPLEVPGADAPLDDVLAHLGQVLGPPDAPGSAGGSQ